jgi:hypothetical protein
VPGREAALTVAYSVDDPADVVLEVTAYVEHDSTISTS